MSKGFVQEALVTAVTKSRISNHCRPRLPLITISSDGSGAIFRELCLLIHGSPGVADPFLRAVPRSAKERVPGVFARNYGQRPPALPRQHFSASGPSGGHLERGVHPRAL